MFDAYNIQDELERKRKELAEVLPAAVQEEPGQEDYSSIAEQVRQDAGEQYQKEQEKVRSTFLDLLMKNQANQEISRKDAEKRERANRARIAFASLADGLAALGNMIGTVHGAANQPLTYQLPFVRQDIEQRREEDRATARRFKENEERYRLLEAKLVGGGDPFAASDVKHAYNMAEIAARGANSENVQQHIDARTQQNNETRSNISAAKAESQERIAAGRNATSRANNKENNETRRYVSDNKAHGSNLTANAKMKWIHDNAAGHLDELEDELATRYGGKERIPYGWRKNWRQYVGSGAFYDKYYRANGWEELGETDATVTKPVENTPPVQQQGDLTTKTPPSKRNTNKSKTPPSKRK